MGRVLLFFSLFFFTTAFTACINASSGNPELLERTCQKACLKLDRCGACRQLGVTKKFCPTMDRCVKECTGSLVQNIFLQDAPRCVLETKGCKKGDLLQCVPQTIQRMLLSLQKE
jgi:hypothetical protein